MQVFDLNGSLSGNTETADDSTIQWYRPKATMKYTQTVAFLVIGAPGCLFILIGVATPQWMTDGHNRSAGLFVECEPAGCLSYSSEAFGITLVVIGFLSSASALVCVIFYYVTDIHRDTTHRILSVVIAGLFLGAAVALLVGSSIVATFGKSRLELNYMVSMDLGYSFALTIIGSIMSCVTGVLALVHGMSL